MQRYATTAGIRTVQRNHKKTQASAGKDGTTPGAALSSQRRQSQDTQHQLRSLKRVPTQRLSAIRGAPIWAWVVDLRSCNTSLGTWVSTQLPPKDHRILISGAQEPAPTSQCLALERSSRRQGCTDLLCYEHEATHNSQYLKAMAMTRHHHLQPRSLRLPPRNTS